MTPEEMIMEWWEHLPEKEKTQKIKTAYYEAKAEGLASYQRWRESNGPGR